MNGDQARHWIKSHGDAFVDLVRIYLGLGLLIKGVFFMGNTDSLMEMISGMGPLWFGPAALAHYAIVAHLVGGLLLTIGLLTRWAAVVQLPVLFGAAFYLYLPKMAQIESRQNLEFTTLVLFLLVLITIYGAGRWSLDYKLSRKMDEETFHSTPEVPKTI